MYFVRTAVVCASLFTSTIFTSTYELDAYTQDLVAVICFFGKALEQETGYKKKEITFPMPEETIQELILQHRVPFIARCKTAFYRDLTVEQRIIALRLLDALHAIAQTTMQDLMAMTTVHDNPDQYNQCNKFLKSYFDEQCGNLSECKSLRAAQVTAALDKIMTINTGDKTYDQVIRFMCRCAYLQDLCTLTDYNGKNVPTMIQLCFVPITQAIESSFVVFEDAYYYEGWQKQFIKNGTIFAYIRSVTGPLLAALTS